MTKSLSTDKNNNNMVVLLHGIGRTYRSMRQLEKALSQVGYHVINIDYPSRKKNISGLVLDVYQQLQKYVNQPGNTVHFVTHSMGGLVLRGLLSQYELNNVGRIVMLAPPNQGSEVADFLKTNVLYKLFYGPAGQELTTLAAKTHPIPKKNFEFGIIAGDRCLDPISYFLLPGKHDGKVTIESTKLQGMTDHIVLAANHTSIMSNKKVIHQVITFLTQGKFDHHPKVT